MTMQGGTHAVTIGHVIGGCFGVAFVVANSASLGSHLRLVVTAAAAAIFALTLFTFARGVADGTVARPETVSERFGRGYWMVIVLEAFALFGGATVLNQVRPAAVVGWIALVVGLHFFWLARLWTRGARELTVVATALSLLGAAGLLIALATNSIDLVAIVSGIGSGAVLLGSSMSGALRSFGRRHPTLVE